MKNSYIVAIGSNTDPEQKVAKVREILTDLFNDVTFSAFHWTSPIGNHYTQPFYNGAVRFECNLNAAELKPILKSIEAKLGRTPEQKTQGIVPMDLDIIVCNGKITHVDYQRFFFVKEVVDTLLTDEKE